MTDATTTRTVETDRLAIAYESHGPADGIPLVLLHGYPDDVRCYDAVVALLAPGGTFRILVPYLRGYGPTRFLSPAARRSGEQAAIGADLRDFLDRLDLRGAVLAGMDWGGRAASVVASLFPERVRGLVACGGYAIQDPPGSAPVAVEDAVRFWYQWYLCTARGARALAEDPEPLARACWRLWSPGLVIDEASFARTAASWQNPDHAAVVAHSYRHRHGEADGDPAYEAIRRGLAGRPRIDVPAIVLDPAADGVWALPDGDPTRALFGPIRDRRVLPGTGHFVPRERPDAFARAIADLVARTA